MTSAKMIGVRIARNHAVEAHTDPCLMIPEATGPALQRAALVPLPSAPDRHIGDG